VHHATLGETCTTAMGHEMSTAALVKQAVALRKGLDDPQTSAHEDQVGPLHTGHARRMVAEMWPRFPTLVTADIDFKELLARLEDGHAASISGVPARIRGASPLKRVGDVGHELGLSGVRRKSGVLQLAVDDPYRPGGKDPRVEWRPAREIRQFAYRDSDRDLLAVFTLRIGSWTAEALMRRRKDLRVGSIEADAAKTERRLRARIKAPGEATLADCAAIEATAREEALLEAATASGAAIDALRREP